MNIKRAVRKYTRGDSDKVLLLEGGRGKKINKTIGSVATPTLLFFPPSTPVRKFITPARSSHPSFCSRTTWEINKMNRVLHRLGSARPKFPSCKRVSCCFHPIRQIVESEKFIRELIHDRVRLLFGGFGFKNIPVKKLFYGRLTERTLRLRPYRRIPQRTRCLFIRYVILTRLGNRLQMLAVDRISELFPQRACYGVCV